MKALVHINAHQKHIHTYIYIYIYTCTYHISKQLHQKAWVITVGLLTLDLRNTLFLPNMEYSHLAGFCCCCLKTVAICILWQPIYLPHERLLMSQTANQEIVRLLFYTFIFFFDDMLEALYAWNKKSIRVLVFVLFWGVGGWVGGLDGRREMWVLFCSSFLVLFCGIHID